MLFRCNVTLARIIAAGACVTVVACQPSRDVSQGQEPTRPVAATASHSSTQEATLPTPPLSPAPSLKPGTPPTPPESLIRASELLERLHERLALQERTIPQSESLILDRLRPAVAELEGIHQAMETQWAQGDTAGSLIYAQELTARLDPPNAAISASKAQGFTMDCPSCRIEESFGRPVWHVADGGWTTVPERLVNPDFSLTLRFMPLRIEQYWDGRLNLGFREFYGISMAPGSTSYPHRYALTAITFEPYALWYTACEFAPPLRNQWNSLSVRVQAATITIGLATGEACHWALPPVSWFGDIAVLGYEILIDTVEVDWLPLDAGQSQPSSTE